jgi:hypothetical protein
MKIELPLTPFASEVLVGHNGFIDLTQMLSDKFVLTTGFRASILPKTFDI